MQPLALLALLFLAAICLRNWRAGLLLCLVVGFVQDPIRKVAPGQPVYLSAAIGVVAALVFLGARLKGFPASLRTVTHKFPASRSALQAFVALVVVESVVALVRTGSPVIAGIGLIAYLAPIPALLLGFYFARDRVSISSFVRCYVFGCVIMGTGIYLSYFGNDSRLLSQVGETQYAYSVSYGAIQLWPGFFRTPETAAWHLATAICLSLVLILSRGAHRSVVKYALAVCLLAPALLLTGRRKFLVEIPVFLIVYLLLLVYFQRGARRAGVAGIGIIAIAVAALAFNPEAFFGNGLRSYFERGAQLNGSMLDRLTDMTVGSFKYVIAQDGIFGLGAGTGSQGAQHFGGGADLVGYAAEGGLGKILAELGIPGLIVLCWLAVALGRSVSRGLRKLDDRDPERARLGDGLTALLLANFFLFLNGHQAFGDVFVLLMLGWIFGFVLAITSWTINTSAAAKPSFFAARTRSPKPAPGLLGVKNRTLPG